MTSALRRSWRVMSLLLAKRPLLAAQACGISPGLLDRASRIAGQEGGAAKRGARLVLYVTLRFGSALPGSSRLTAAAARLSPRLHDALLRRYIAYGSNGMDWRPPPAVLTIIPGAHEAAILSRLSKLASSRH